VNYLTGGNSTVTFTNCHFDHFSYSVSGAEFSTVECETDGAAFSDFPAVCFTRTTTISRSPSRSPLPSLLPPSVAFQYSLIWFDFSLNFSRSHTFISGTFPGSPAFQSSQIPIESGGDSNTELKVGSLVGIVVGGIVMISVIITLVVLIYRGRICVWKVSSESQDSYTSKSIISPLMESLIEEPETVVTNSAFWDFSQDFVSTTEWRTDSVG
jgi:hypothetical protein